MRMRIMDNTPRFLHTCMYMYLGLWMLCVSECVVVCRCFDMQSKSPAPGCNVSLVGSNQARVTVTNVGSKVTQPTLSSGLGRGVVITPLSIQNQRQAFISPASQANTIVPKLLIKAVCKSSSKKEAVKTCKTFTLRNVNVGQVITRDQLKQLIKLQLDDDVTDEFDVGYYQATTVVTIRSPQDVMEVWNDVKKGVKVILWCDGLKESNPTTSKSRKRSKKKIDSDSDSDEDAVVVTSGRTAKKKKSDKDEQLEKIVTELKDLHEQQYTPMQYRIWGEMIIGGLYSSKTDAPNTSMFSRAGGKEPKKKSEVAEALGEVAKHLSSAIAGAVPSGKRSTSSCSVVTSPAKSIDNRSKCYKQLGDLSELRNSGVLTEDEYLREKEAVMITLKKL